MEQINILLVEDNPSDVDLFNEYLINTSEARYIISSVDSLKSYWEHIKDTRIDILFLDLGLPDSKGLDTLMKVLARTPELPIIVLTGQSDIRIGIRAVKYGAQDFLTKSDLNTIILEKAIHHAIERKRLILELESLKNLEHHRAVHDPLTGLPNRIALMNKLDSILKHAKRSHERFALLFIDLDYFKAVNDTSGHEAGDIVLQKVSLRLRVLLRESDIIARIGGDEFVCVIRDIIDDSDISNVTSKVIKKLQEPIKNGQEEYYIGSSIGIALYPQDGITSEDLLRSADAAMYIAKENGRNRFQYAQPELNQLIKQHYHLDHELGSAIKDHELNVYFQPIVDAASEEIVACEALVRWLHPMDGLLMPDTFIPQTEKSGLIIRLGEYVLRETANYRKQWLQHRFKDIRIAVNISALHFRRPNFVERLVTILDEVEVDTTWLDLEITESVILHRTPEIIAQFNQLKQLGIGIKVDDFGTGYSSLSYLRDYPLSALKIDKSFVLQAPESQRDQAIIRAIIAMAEQLGLDVIAEGTESQQHVALLQQLGCKYLQGYFYSEPLHQEKFKRYLCSNTQKEQQDVISL